MHGKYIKTINSVISPKVQLLSFKFLIFIRKGGSLLNIIKLEIITASKIIKNLVSKIIDVTLKSLTTLIK